MKEKLISVILIFSQLICISFASDMNFWGKGNKLKATGDTLKILKKGKEIELINKITL